MITSIAAIMVPSLDHNCFLAVSGDSITATMYIFFVYRACLFQFYFLLVKAHLCIFVYMPILQFFTDSFIRDKKC